MRPFWWQFLGDSWILGILKNFEFEKLWIFKNFEFGETGFWEIVNFGNREFWENWEFGKLEFQPVNELGFQCRTSLTWVRTENEVKSKRSTKKRWYFFEKDEKWYHLCLTSQDDCRKPASTVVHLVLGVFSNIKIHLFLSPLCFLHVFG